MKSRCFLFFFSILVFILDFRLVGKSVFLYFNVNVYLKEIPCLNKVTLPYLTLPLLQSAYRKFNSTEKALFNVHNDILSNMDQKRVTLLFLLDLSTAFDTVDHEVLLRPMENSFGISSTAL